jgi:hypothetical protein
VRVAEVALTVPVVTDNVAEMDPWGTVTDDGTLAPVAFELDSEMTVPPVTGR